jgi:hypothetical protein
VINDRTVIQIRKSYKKILKKEKDLFLQFIDSSDTILLGRKMTDGYVNHWDNVISNNPDNLFA